MALLVNSSEILKIYRKKNYQSYTYLIIKIEK